MAPADPASAAYDPEMEMNRLSFKEGSVAHGSMREPASLYDTGGRSSRASHRDRGRDALGRWLDSFKRDPNRRITPVTVIHTAADRARVGYTDDGGEGGDRHSREERGVHYYDVAAANISTVDTGLARELKGRHLQMIAIGGSIGRILLSSA